MARQRTLTPLIKVRILVPQPCSRPRLALQDELKNDTLKQVQIENLELKRTFYLVTPAKRTLPSNFQQLINRFLNR